MIVLVDRGFIFTVFLFEIAQGFDEKGGIICDALQERNDLVLAFLAV